jgi:hypothetical protein
MADRSSALSRDIAVARLHALEAERRAILAVFPDLRIGVAERRRRVKTRAAERPRLVRAAKRRVVGAATGGDSHERASNGRRQNP